MFLKLMNFYHYWKLEVGFKMMTIVDVIPLNAHCTIICSLVMAVLGYLTCNIHCTWNVGTVYIFGGNERKIARDAFHFSHFSSYSGVGVLFWKQDYEVKTKVYKLKFFLIRLIALIVIMVSLAEIEKVQSLSNGYTCTPKLNLYQSSLIFEILSRIKIQRLFFSKLCATKLFIFSILYY